MDFQNDVHTASNQNVRIAFEMSRLFTIYCCKVSHAEFQVGINISMFVMHEKVRFQK